MYSQPTQRMLEVLASTYRLLLIVDKYKYMGNEVVVNILFLQWTRKGHSAFEIHDIGRYTCKYMMDSGERE